MNQFTPHRLAQLTRDHGAAYLRDNVPLHIRQADNLRRFVRPAPPELHRQVAEMDAKLNRAGVEPRRAAGDATLEDALTNPKVVVRCSKGNCGAHYVPGGFSVGEWQSRTPPESSEPTEEGLGALSGSKAAPEAPAGLRPTGYDPARDIGHSEAFASVGVGVRRLIELDPKAGEALNIAIGEMRLGDHRTGYSAGCAWYAEYIQRIADMREKAVSELPARQRIAEMIRAHEVCSGADAAMGLHLDLADEILAVPEIGAATEDSHDLRK